MRFDLVIKFGPKEVANLEGKLEVSHIPVGELEEIIHLENRLEVLTGYRFHINLSMDEPTDAHH